MIFRTHVPIRGVTWRHDRRVPAVTARRRRRTPRSRRLAPHRTELGDGAWIDVQRGWLQGSDALFERLRDAVPWRAERRQMYERVVDVPRLLAFYDRHLPLPDPVVVTMKQHLDAHYLPELGEPFATAGLCLYRDGRDSVAWHGDRIGRSSTEDTIVAIVVLGEPRALLLRPRGGGGDPAARSRSRRPDRDGRQLPAHLGARRPEERAARRPAHQHPVPGAGRALIRSRSSSARRGPTPCPGRTRGR